MTANFWNYDMLLILACKLTGEDGCVQQMEYSPIIGGYTLVLTSGKALFVIPPSTKIENSVSSVTRSCSIDSVWGLNLTVLKETEKKITASKNFFLKILYKTLSCLYVFLCQLSVYYFWSSQDKTIGSRSFRGQGSIYSCFSIAHNVFHQLVLFCVI